jgi:pimeloyl-ACP methyl ester carboxylesterase
MRRGWKILIGVVAGLLVVLVLNAIVTSNETRPAEVTEPGGRILDLEGGAIQVVDHGPRNASPIVLIHCFSCAINWWNRMMPLLDKAHRVVAVDLLGHGGSEKPDSGYSIPDQANLVAEAMARLGVSHATVVGHSLGGGVAVALAEQSPALVARLVIIDSRASPDEGGGLGTLANLAFVPVIGQALWRIKPDFSIRDGLGVAFAPGFEVPDEFVQDVRRMTYTAYEESHEALDDYTSEESLADRIAATRKPLLVIMGEEDQIIKDPKAAAAAYQAAVPTAFTDVIEGVGHSPNVEEPNLTSELVLGFAGPPNAGRKEARRRQVQKRVQNQEGVRAGP